VTTNRPKTKILVDGGDPGETRRVKDLLGFVDGQTTNPSLIAKNPEIRQLLASGRALSAQEEKDEYRKIVQSVSPLVGDADAATKGAREPVYVSPFVGRLDDHGENGMDLVKNIKKMYEATDGHVYVLAASIRHLEHLLCSFALDVELATVPIKVLEQWAAKNFPMPGRDFSYKGEDPNGEPLKAIPYKALNLNRSWDSFDIAHELTTKGIEKFVADYRSTLRRSA
jgi:transaldolase